MEKPMIIVDKMNVLNALRVTKIKEDTYKLESLSCGTMVDETEITIHELINTLLEYFGQKNLRVTRKDSKHYKLEKLIFMEDMMCGIAEVVVMTNEELLDILLECYAEKQ